ncbi:MAG TPA: serine/threonine-protein kinase, partial [Gemmatimonadaceae bacterium]|nr:serine/threonine-protein kinase [Gemmatimonadaceae bacterium]
MNSDVLGPDLRGRYRVERELGAGGMATVYLADDLKHHRQVAIKVLHSEISALVGPERFLKEIELTASLQHPHILPLFDSGSADGLLYYVMPFVDGDTLRRRLEREKQLPIADAVRIATEVADALQYAHGRGIVHRDIKPENVLLQDGHALVADFGIALAVQQAGGQRMTQTGFSLGTPQYVSPEQAMGERDIGPRSDVYSLGAVTYEMLAGEAPFTGPTMQAIVAQVITGEPRSLAARRKSVPPHVDAAVSTALEKLPADRFENAKAFADALGDLGFRAGSARSTVPARTSRSRMVPLLGTALVAVAALGAWGWLRPAPTAAAGVAWRVPIALPDSVVPGGDVSISGDGSTIFFGAEVHGVRQLYRLTSATGRAEPVPGVPGGWISPDGRRVAYQKGTGDIVVLPLGGGVPAVVAHIERARLGHWLDDGHLLVKDQDGLLSVPTGGGAPIRLIRRDSIAIYDNAAPLPPGDGILFNIFAYGGRFDTARAGIAAVGLRGGKVVRLTQGRFAEFAPPDHLIVNRVGDGSIVAFPFDPKRLRITGPSVPIVTGLPPGGYSDVGEFDVSATGRMVYLEGDDSR